MFKRLYPSKVQITNPVFVIIYSDPADDDRSIMTEQLDTVPKEEKSERELRRPSLDKHKKEKPLKTGRGRISTPERKIAKKEPSTVSRDEVRRKKGLYNTCSFSFYAVLWVAHLYTFSLRTYICANSMTYGPYYFHRFTFMLVVTANKRTNRNSSSKIH